MECSPSSDTIANLRQQRAIGPETGQADVQVSIFCPGCGYKKKITEINGDFKKLYKLKQQMKCPSCGTTGFHMSLKTRLRL